MLDGTQSQSTTWSFWQCTTHFCGAQFSLRLTPKSSLYSTIKITSRSYQIWWAWHFWQFRIWWSTWPSDKWCHCLKCTLSTSEKSQIICTLSQQVTSGGCWSQWLLSSFTLFCWLCAQCGSMAFRIWALEAFVSIGEYWLLLRLLAHPLEWQWAASYPQETTQWWWPSFLSSCLTWEQAS